MKSSKTWYQCWPWLDPYHLHTAAMQGGTFLGQKDQTIYPYLICFHWMLWGSTCGWLLTGSFWSWLMVFPILFFKLAVRLRTDRNVIRKFWKLFLFTIFQSFSRFKKFVSKALWAENISATLMWSHTRKALHLFSEKIQNVSQETGGKMCRNVRAEWLTCFPRALYM